MKEHKKVEFIEEYIRNGNDYQWNDNHGELVRCKDCKHRYSEGENVRYNLCELNRNKAMPDEWFCADGERK